MKLTPDIKCWSLIMFLIGCFGILHSYAKSPLPPAPALGPPSSTPPPRSQPKTPSSLPKNTIDLSGIWVADREATCWTDAKPNNRGNCNSGTLVKLVLNEMQGAITGHFFGPFSSWLRPDKDHPHVNSDGTVPFEAANFDGTTLRLRSSFKLTSHPQEKQIYSWELTVGKGNPNVLTGRQRVEELNPNGNTAINYEMRFNREGAPIVQVRKPGSQKTPAPGGSWIPWVLIPGIGWVLYMAAQKGRKRNQDQKEYELDIRTQDDRTSLNTDGEDILWVYGQVRCNKPEVNTEAMTSALTFAPEGSDARWLEVGSAQRINGFKTVPVRAWPPAVNAELINGEATIMVSTVIEGSKISGPVTLTLEAYELEVFSEEASYTESEPN